jgi:anti-anti-sigma regulatory factor
MRAELLGQLDGNSTDVVVVDFADVRSASNSFVDEFIGKLAGEMGSRRLEVINASPMIARTIERSLRRRGLDADRILAAMLAHA